MPSAPPLGSPPSSLRSAFARSVAKWCAVGFAVRLLLLLAAGDLELQSDEANYVYLALGWQRFGFLGDAERFLWPPAWPFVLRLGLDAFGRDGLFAVRLFEVFASISIGASAMGIARRISGEKAGRIAGGMWAFYLPLAAYTHYLWAEPLFLALLAPAIYLLVAAEQENEPRRVDRRLVGAGLLFGGALLVKEAPLFLVPLLALGLLLAHRRPRLVEGARRALLFALAVAAVVVPWTVRNAEVYGRFAPVGISLGENAYGGLNSQYTNFDLRAITRRRADVDPLESLSRAGFAGTDPATKWERSWASANAAVNSGENLRRGLAWLRAHPGDFLRTRVKKLADLVMPTSFFVRHQAMAMYEGVLGRSGVRQGLVLWALLAAAALLILAAPGAWAVLARAGEVRGSWIPLLVTLYFFSTALLVSMSRFRLPLVPCLLLFAATFLAGVGRESLRRPVARAAVGALWAVLLFLWWVDWPELIAIWELAWTS